MLEDAVLSDKARAYLAVDAFMVDVAGATALSTAFETGVIDYLQGHPGENVDALQAALGLDAPGLKVLLGMLRANGVLEPLGNSLLLTGAFAAALTFRDVLEAKLHFAKLVAPDFIRLLTALLMEPAVFTEQARIFKLFSYQYALHSSVENREHTARWMRLTTALTRHEASACLDVHDFSGYRRMLDVGGNSGEFALQLCRVHTRLQAIIYDLPVVCEIGSAHVALQPESDRLFFVQRNPSQHALPGGCDLVTFKSMLHDWPDAEMFDFLSRAYEALVPGGTLMIFERGVVDLGEKPLAYGQLPLFLFFRSYRRPEDYQAVLQSLGFICITQCGLQLDMRFILITALKPDIFLHKPSFE